MQSKKQRPMNETERTDKRTRILYYDREHRRRQITIPRTDRENLYLDILDYDRINGTHLYDEISLTAIRKVVKLD